jgi:ribosome-associated toxin RatA of RatAB toxin-antitoxin module
MTRLKHTVDIQRPLADVYARARAVERYPEFLPGYVSSRIVSWDNGRALIERQARVRRKLHQWQSWVRFEDNASLHFEHATGTLQGMQVHWRFDSLGLSQTRLSIIHEIHLSRPPLIGRWLERFVYGPQINSLAAQVVTAFKQACETTAEK